MLKIIANEIKKLIDFRPGKERDNKIVEDIETSVEFRGSRLWDLIFAIAICSIGLNINSVPVIIGAMLISPLMGPIVGLGLSLGTNDFLFLKKSFANLMMATIMGVVVSALYFSLTPISNAQAELLSRIDPTIYDVLIAFFGGLAGIIGLIRLEKGNVIPGVAIATALMPPLCTVGYGIATNKLNFVYGALYLYGINCIFICLATLLVVKYLRLRPIYSADILMSKRVGRVFAMLVVAMLVPAIYSAYIFIGNNNYIQSANKYINDVFTQKGYTVIYQDVNYKAKPHTIDLAVFAASFTPAEIDSFKAKLASYGLGGTDLTIKQDNELDLTNDQWSQVLANIQAESDRIKLIEAQLAKNPAPEPDASQILAEAQKINNKIVKIALGNMSVAENLAIESGQIIAGQPIVQAVIVYYSFDPKKKDNFSTEEQATMSEWLKTRLSNDDLTVYFINFPEPSLPTEGDENQ